MKRARLALAAICLGSTACSPPRVEESSIEELRFETGPAPPRIEVRLARGSIEVVPSETNEVEVVFRKRARAVDRNAARSLLESITADGRREDDGIRIVGRGKPGPGTLFGTSMRTDLTLRVPPDSELDIRTRDGRIGLDSVRATISAETGHGRIRLHRVEGSVTLRTADGSITGTELRGDFDVLSEDGRIHLEGSFGALRAVTGDGSIRVTCREAIAGAAGWLIRTSDGSIELALPRSLSAELEASTSDGRIVNDLSDFVGRERDGRLKGTLRGGGALILVTTMDGRITLRDS